MVSLRGLFLAITAAAVARADVSECFYLKGVAGGQSLSWATVSQPTGNKNYLATFTTNGLQASKFGVNPKTSELRVFSTGNNINGRTAAIAPKSTSAFLIFDTKTSMLLGGRKALVCSVVPVGILSCTAGDNSAVSVSQYCPPYWSIADRERTALGCSTLTLQAVAASGCGNFSTGVGPNGNPE